MSGYVGYYPPQSLWTRVRLELLFEVQAFPMTARYLGIAALVAIARGVEAT